jgi:sec-independent protein translocase protein TatA
MSLSLAQLIVILLIILVLFGAGRLPQVMADLGKGMKAFKSALKDEENKKE